MAPLNYLYSPKISTLHMLHNSALQPRTSACKFSSSKKRWPRLEIQKVKASLRPQTETHCCAAKGCGVIWPRQKAAEATAGGAWHPTQLSSLEPPCACACQPTCLRHQTTCCHYCCKKKIFFKKQIPFNPVNMVT